MHAHLHALKKEYDFIHSLATFLFVNCYVQNVLNEYLDMFTLKYQALNTLNFYLEDSIREVWE